MLLAALCATTALAASEKRASFNSVSGRVVKTPGSAAIVKRLPVRVVIRVPRHTRGAVRVRAGRRDVTRRFRRLRGSLRVARLGRREGIVRGRNHLSVLAQRRGRRPAVSQVRSFVVANRRARLVSMRLRLGAPTRVSLAVAGRPRRSRQVSMWLNGRRVTPHLDRSRLSRWSASLSASHGLRYGVNRIRVAVVEPNHGRYHVIRRSFRVKRSRHLAGAGRDSSARPGDLVRLEGRRSRAAGDADRVPLG